LPEIQISISRNEVKNSDILSNSSVISDNEFKAQ